MQNTDTQDRAILRHLQDDPSQPLARVAAAVGLSNAALSRRVERLEQSGVIAARRWRVDPVALGLAVEVSLRITADKTVSNALDRLIAAARDISEVTEIQTFLGRVDVRLNIRARDMAHYQEIYRTRILALPHLQDIEALMLVSTIKDSQALPL